MAPRDFLAAVVVVLIWGFNFVVVKLGVEELPPLLLTSLRFFTVTLVLAAFVRPRKSDIVPLSLLSVTLGTAHFGLLFSGIRHVDAATAAIVVQLGVPFSALLAALVYGDAMGIRRWGGLALAFGGVVLLAGEPTLPSPLGLVLVVGGAFAWAVSNMVIKRLRDVPPATVNGWMAMLAAPQLLALSLVFEDGHAEALTSAGLAGWGAVAFTALGASLIAYTLWYRLLARYPVSTVVPFTLLAPVIGVFAGILLLGEPATWQKGLGGVLTLMGVLIVQLNVFQDRKAQPAGNGKPDGP